ncbi:hypothetical protein BB561_002488 [Smittium simulii]|uniref:HD/PDEase domain-containing protein n=1 Tax=Smittium simulii TaxID=133385 RepID=A0A2T9YQB7_9FUNG|nr:hypothetical protein BB561_002488 [Smittium simulii]
MESSDFKYLKDPIYGSIKLESLVLKFIDTRQFQRLRYLKQLGSICFIYPGGNHTRFEHSIGVSHLAKTLITILREKQPELAISDRDVRCITLAGLCHDLGHGPFSHLFDSAFISTIFPEKNWCHENGSEMMLEYLIKKNNIALPREDIDFIKDLILGEPIYTKQKEKKFMFQIVANKQNGIDVDRFDYIARDSYYTGLKSTYDYDQICFDHKELFDIYELLHSRYSLNKRIYLHKTAKAIDLMLCDALVLSDKYLKISDSINDPEKYTYLTDDIMHDIERSDCDELKSSKELVQRIHCRDLYKLVDAVTMKFSQLEAIGKEWISSKIIVDQCKAEEDPEKQEIKDFNDDKIRINWSIINFGMGAVNPLTKVKFYKKPNTNTSYNIDTDKEIVCLPPEYQEVLLRVYVTEEKYKTLAHNALKQVYTKVGLNI